MQGSGTHTSWTPLWESPLTHVSGAGRQLAYRLPSTAQRPICSLRRDMIGRVHRSVSHGPHVARYRCCLCNAIEDDFIEDDCIKENSDNDVGKWADADGNQLHTQLRLAVEAEDYSRAGALRDEMDSRRIAGGENKSASWQQLGLPDWLAERAEQYGFRFPTEVQGRTASAVLSGRDCVVQSETGSGKTLAFLLPALARVTPGQPGPQCVVLVPTLELGVQTALLVYKLWGGSINPGVPGLAGNMFAYTGPRGMKVRGVLDKDEVQLAKNHGVLSRTDLLVATPDALAEVMAEPGAVPDALSNARCLIIDEVDACFQAHSVAMEAVLTSAAAEKPRPAVIAVGATVQDGFSAAAQQMGWMEAPSHVVVGEGSVPSSLQHRMIVCDSSRSLAVLCRQIRADLKRLGDDSPAARVLVFTPDETAAATVGDSLRKVLWGEHRIAVLLPHGQEPIKALHAFRDNAASLLVATPAAARGLDLPEVSYVFNVGLPADSKDYLHRAGRAGRMGGIVPGVVVTVVPEEQKEALLAIAQELKISMLQLPEPALDDSGDPDSQKRDLEDLYNLF